jgi:hypothetical protein
MSSERHTRVVQSSSAQDSDHQHALHSVSQEGVDESVGGGDAGVPDLKQDIARQQAQLGRG